MGNITGTLIENAFLPQANNRPSLNIQEEIEKLTRESSNRELYRLLHAEMEHGTKERTPFSAGQGHQIAEIAESDDVRGGMEKLESSRSSGGHSYVQNFASLKRGDDLQRIAEHSQSRGKDPDLRNGTTNATTVLGSSDKKKMVPDHDDSSNTQRMAFKKKILNSYRTENVEVPAKVDNSAVSSREPEVRIEESACLESTSKNALDINQKHLMRVLNFDNCIQVIVMNELQKLESMPDDVLGSKKLQLFGMLDGDSQKNKPGEVSSSEVSKARSSAETSWPSRIEKTAGQVPVSCDPTRDKWPPYGRLEYASSQMPPETSPHRAAVRKAEDGQNAISMRNTPSAYRTVGHFLDASVTPEVPRTYSSAPGEGTARNSRQMGNQSGETSGGEAITFRGPPLVRYSHPGMWDHSQEIPAAQPSPHFLSPGTGYRMTPSNQMVHQLIDHPRKIDKEIEPVKLARTEYSSYSGPLQYPLNPGQPTQHSSYQNSPPMQPDKHHKMDAASYLYPAKVASRDHIHSQYETSYLNHHESLQPPPVNYLKRSPKNSPVLSYEKELSRPLGEPQYNRPELMKASPGCASVGLGSIRNYRTLTDPPSHVGYRGERPSRPDAQPDKRAYGVQSAEDFEFEKHFRRPSAGYRDVPMVSEQLIQQSISASLLPRGRENPERSGAGPVEETPLDLTAKKDVGSGHHPSVYLLPPGAKQHQADWELAKSVLYKPSYVREEDQVHANMFRPASHKTSDFVVPEQIGRRDVVDSRQAYDKAPPNFAMIRSDSDFGRIIPTPVQERNQRTSVIASHPFDDTVSNLGQPSHLTMQQMSEALMKNQLQSVSNWKQSTYQEILPQSRALLLDKESYSFQGDPERTRTRPNNPNGDQYHHSATSPTIPHLSPIQPLVAPAGSQAPGGRRVTGPSLLGSHSPSDILHLQCKVCGSTYGSLRSFRMHFAKVHGLEPLPEHCNISTISGTKNAMSKVTPVDDNEPPALQRETLPSDIRTLAQSQTFAFDDFSNGSRSVKLDVLRTEVPPVSARTKQVAEVFPMPVRVTHGLSSPQLLKLDPMVRRPDLNDVQVEATETKAKTTKDAKGVSHIINCDLGIIRSRNCYSDLGCDVDCPECLDGFKDISDWKMHISTHMMRSCTCKACGISFTHSGALKKHLQAAHMPAETVDVEYRCLFCREVFSDEKILFHHTQEHEKKYSRVDNVCWESGSWQSFKQRGGSMDSKCIQMAIPDTTSSDDVRPTSGFGENSRNVSPNTDSKGSSFDRKSFTDLLASGHSNVDPDNIRKLEAIKTEDEKACRGGVADQSGNIRTMLHRAEGYGLGCDPALIKPDSGWPSRSPGFESVARSGSSDPEKDLKPVKVSEESIAFVSKKQAFLKRFKSIEERESIENEASRLSSLAMPSNSNGLLPAGRSATGLAAPADNVELQPAMHLRDLFSIMGHQVEKSIRGIPDFPPVSSFGPTQRSRCVRDVCDEIIAQSFRKDKTISSDSVSSISMLESLELNSSDKMKEQFITLVNMESETRPSDVQRSRSGAEASFGQSGVWAAGSPCSSRDSYHSLEIDESQFDKERSAEDSTQIVHVECTDVEKRSLDYESPRQEPEQRSTSDSRGVVNQDFRASESEAGGTQASSEYYFKRQENLDASASEDFACRTASVNSKESCSPSSTQKLEAYSEGDLSSEMSFKAKSSDRILTSGRGQKRKRSSSDASLSKGTNDADNEKPSS